jgi:predicted RND superfamily exporter protein
MATTNYIFNRRAPDTRVVPTHSRDIESLWRQFGRVRGEHYVYRVLSDDHSRGILTVYLKNANYRDTQALLQDIRAYEAAHLAPHGIHLDFGGDVAVSQTLIRSIVQTQVGSLLFSLLGVLLVSILFNRSWRLGLLTVLPCTFAILLNFGFMGWAGMPLGVATSMFAGMILGIGVDFAIHLLDRYRRLRAAGLGINEAMGTAASLAGRPILIDAVAVGLGFGVLMISRVPANARLGTLALLCVAVCVLATLALLPSLIVSRRR